MKADSMIVNEVQAKTILSKSKVFDYTINPYVGCQHGCTYCYARFMKRFTGHREKWGEFVDAKINAPALLNEELRKKRRGSIWISGVCDPYQPLERKYELTKECLETLLRHRWPISIQTRSSLVTRDLHLLRRFDDLEVGLTITTADDKIREIFEPNAPPVKNRIETVKKLHTAGLRTFVMIAPLLPQAEGLAELLPGKADYVLIDRMNYHHADWVYREHGLEDAMSRRFFDEKKTELAEAFEEKSMPYRLLF